MKLDIIILLTVILVITVIGSIFINKAIDKDNVNREKWSLVAGIYFGMVFILPILSVFWR